MYALLRSAADQTAATKANQAHAQPSASNEPLSSNRPQSRGQAEYLDPGRPAIDIDASRAVAAAAAVARAAAAAVPPPLLSKAHSSNSETFASAATA